MSRKVIVALSGGVDSSVAAYLLREQGFRVIGVTLNLEQSVSNFKSVLNDAERVAKKLGIEFYTADYREHFKTNVVEPFVYEYLAGRTPNPCVLCNKSIKWEMLMNEAKAHNADFVATGHYAKLSRLGIGERYSLKMAANSDKDQTYALYRLSQRQLSKTIFPIGDYSKKEVRKIAEKIGIGLHDKPDSQEICFIPDNDHAAYIESFTGLKGTPGEFVMKDGTSFGASKGICNYTVGQRKGLGISYSEPLFVQKIDAVNNKIIIGRSGELFTKDLSASSINFMGLDSAENLECIGKIRYAHKGAKCSVTINKDKLLCRFHEPQRAVTPGQSAVFYNDTGEVLFGGIII